MVWRPHRWPKLPVVSGREVVRALQRAGFVVDRRVGSHVTMVNAATARRATLPVHGSEDLPPGTLRSILRQAGLTVDEFVLLLA
jgi:predicted RNA binding protein YcfA (HicA-like mRNA interferase family)